MYSPDKGFVIYSQDIWWSDKWDGLDYGCNFDFSRSFFEQFGELMKKVPKISLSTEKLENSPYVNYCGWIKNCHLMTLSGYDENCYYSHGLRYSKNSLDCTYSQYLENCYFVSDSLHCNFCFFLQNSKDCQFCWHSQNLLNCSYCSFSAHLVGKEYYFLNEKMTKENYTELMKRLKEDRNFYQECEENFSKLVQKIPQKSNKNI
jgi:hypothetical protein